MPLAVPVIAIDGPSGAGKGTVARRVAAALGFHTLDSGALYRLVGLAAVRDHVALDDEPALVRLTLALQLRFDTTATGAERIWLDEQDVTAMVRSEAAGFTASAVAALPSVRTALVTRQRACAVAPGLVADGRDMGSMIFPDAALKIFLTASAEERAQRRLTQLQAQHAQADLATVTADIIRRDHQDATRAVAPLRAWPDAVQIDTTGVPVDRVVAQVLQLAADRAIEPTRA
jgi:cytidylate kinase